MVREFLSRTGAEAKISMIDWYGKRAISKLRLPKDYRDPKLDQILRTRRTKQEVELIHLAKYALVETPSIYFLDPLKSEIIMEYIEGMHLKDLNSEEKETKAHRLYSEVGRYAAKLHSKKIIHGDLTTKNVIITNERPVVIDFGLSFVSDRLEDRAEDLHLLKQAIKSSFEMRTAVRLFAKAIEGYESVAGEKVTSDVQRQLAEIEQRGRYARVD